MKDIEKNILSKICWSLERNETEHHLIYNTLDVLGALMDGDIKKSEIFANNFESDERKRTYDELRESSFDRIEKIIDAQLMRTVLKSGHISMVGSWGQKFLSWKIQIGLIKAINNLTEKLA